MKRAWTLLVLVASILLSCSGTNHEEEYPYKLSDIRVRDPFILPHEESGIYYLYVSMANELGFSGDQLGVNVYKSRDLKNWSKPIAVFEVTENFWGREAVWAPEVHEYKDKYYLFTTFTSSKVLPGVEGRPLLRNRGTQILAADSPEGPFQPFENKPHISSEWMTLDGTLWVEDGKPYLVFCHEWVQTTDGTMELVELENDLSGIIGEPRTLFSASEAEWVRNMKDIGVAYQDTLWDGYVTDGCFLYKTKSGNLLMIWSSFGEEKYAVGIAESESGKIQGPWKQIDEPLFKANGGHGMIFRTFEGKLMLTFHQPNIGPEERARLFELEDTGDLIKLKRK